MASIRIVAMNSNIKHLPTVNVLTSGAGPRFTQVGSVSANVHKTVQAAGAPNSTVKNLKSIVVPGYSAPS